VLLVVAVRQDRRSRHAQPDAVAFGTIVRRARRGELAVDGRLKRAGQALAAEAGRVVHPGEAGVEAGTQEVQPVHRRRVVTGEELADLAAEVVGRRRCGSQPGVVQHSGPPAT
jgi:hypothetical protein